MRRTAMMMGTIHTAGDVESESDSELLMSGASVVAVSISQRSPVKPDGHVHTVDAVVAVLLQLPAWQNARMWSQMCTPQSGLVLNTSGQLHTPLTSSHWPPLLHGGWQAEGSVVDDVAVVTVSVVDVAVAVVVVCVRVVVVSTS